MRIIHICVYIYVHTRVYFRTDVSKKTEMKINTYKRKTRKREKNEKSIKRLKKKKERLCILFSDLHCMRRLAQPISYPFLTVYILHPSY